MSLERAFTEEPDRSYTHLNEALAMVRFQTYPIPNGEQQSFCQLCQRAQVGSVTQVERWIRNHRAEHLRNAAQAAIEDKVRNGE